VDRRAGRISSDETRELAELLNDEIPEVDGSQVELVPLTEHRLVMIVRGEGMSHLVTDNDPHGDGKPLLRSQPLEEAEDVGAAGRLADLVNKWEIRAIRALSGAELNARRRGQSLPVANAVLVRGAGQAKRLVSFQEKHGMKACAIAGGALYKGVAKVVGMRLIEVPGANGMPDTNIDGKLKASADALSSYDFVFLHVKATDYFSHKRDPVGKAKFISFFDQRLPLLMNGDFGSTTVMITGDHTTACDRGMHTGEPVPMLLSGPSIRMDRTKTFSEREAACGSLGRINGTSVIRIALDSTERTVELGTRPSPKKVTYMPSDLAPLEVPGSI